MKSKYLNEENLQFYTDAYHHVLNCEPEDEDEFWKLDDGVEDHLNLINTNNSIRVMYSKRKLRPETISYVTICFTKEVEEYLRKKLVPSLESYNGIQESRFRPYFEEPEIKSDEWGESSCVEYLRKPEYWNVWNLKLELKNGTPNLHNKFWNDLSKKLSEMDSLK